MPETVGRYRILRPLGRGAMGLVYLAEDPSLNRQVAIKMLDVMADSETDREFLRSRLLRDAKAAAILSHPNIVSVFDIVEEDQAVFVVMEYIEGESVATYLDHTPTPDPAFIVGVLRQVAAGLDYTHTRGIIHRDIKPANIMISTAGVAKILDFGIARMIDTRTSTPTGMVMGTVDYMAPEQIKAEMIDGRADQFSLAAVAYRMVTGSTLFGRHTLATLAYKLVNEAPQPVCVHNSTVPPAVDSVFTKALAKSPADRYPTCSAFADALGRAFSGEPAPIPETAAVSTPVPVSVPSSASAAFPAAVPAAVAAAAPVLVPVPAPAGKRSKLAPILAGAALLAGGGAFAVWKYSSRPATPPVVTTHPEPVEKATGGESPKPVEAPQPEPVQPEEAPVPKSAPQKTPTGKTPTVAKTPALAAAPVATAAKQESAPVVPESPPVAVEAPMEAAEALPEPLPPSSPAAKETYMHKGQDAMRHKDFPEAVRDFTRAVELHPKMILAYANRGLAYQLSDQFPNAIQDYSDAIRLGSNDPHVLANRGYCERKTHQEDLALADFNRALAQDQKLPVALNGRGNIYLHRRQYKLAIDDFTALIRLRPRSIQAYQNRAAARKAMGDNFGAADDYAIIDRLKRK